MEIKKVATPVFLFDRIHMEGKHERDDIDLTLQGRPASFTTGTSTPSRMHTSVDRSRPHILKGSPRFSKVLKGSREQQGSGALDSLQSAGEKANQVFSLR
ncbi:hypothetical protein EYF80_010280 [Liparis tanakae]|uniref:Uncharacterized protein n=1 Tax=Liparis tanakae TaxID=230148 RepID=A0A4Z2INK3_9TELE|nr:hypothetical protein EYF80_010280 [Liparis tanakae]